MKIHYIMIIDTEKPFYEKDFRKKKSFHIKTSIQEEDEKNNSNDDYELCKKMFDWERYIQYYKDLKKSVLKTKELAWEHWIHNGIYEDRRLFLKESESNETTFDWEKYIDHYEDLAENLRTREEAWEHWFKHGKKEKRFFFLTHNGKTFMNDFEEYSQFDWETYVNNYEDLSHMNSKLEAWTHWLKHGKKEKRVYYNLHEKKPIKELGSRELGSRELVKKPILKETLFKKENGGNNRIILKKKYDDYGLHYFGWKGVMNSLIQFLIKKNVLEELKVNKTILFDEWIEKLLMWGNKSENEELLKEIHANHYNLISFAHNPPYEKYFKFSKEEKKEIHKHVLFSEALLNKNLFQLLETNYLKKRFVYLYTLSNSHKQYIYNHYPEYRKNLTSIYHPIDLKVNPSNLFDYESFRENKKIFLIGWWLRNFKSFFDFKLLNSFQKNILVKKSFETKWVEMSENYDLRNVEVFYNLSNYEYEKIFKNSILFLDLEDAVANNVILECIRFCTPIIVKKLDSVVEYLGPDYPLYFSCKKDLKRLESYNEEDLLEIILDAHEYLLEMNKSHLSLDTFNKKVMYDLQKLDITENQQQCRLTWFTIIDKEEDIHSIPSFMEQFLQQDLQETIMLKIFILNNNNNAFEECFNLLETYREKHKNIQYFVIEEKHNYIYEYFDLCMKNAETDYFTIVNTSDVFEKNYSSTYIDYLDQSPNCDIGFSSFIIRNLEDNNEKLVIYGKDVQLFPSNIEGQILVDTAFVWRTKIHTILETNDYMETKSMIEIVKKCLYDNLNLCCVSEELLYSI